MNILLILLTAAVLSVVWVRARMRGGKTNPAFPGLVVLALLLALLGGGARWWFRRGYDPLSYAERMAAHEKYVQSACYRLGQIVAEDIPPGSELLIVHEGHISPPAQRRLEGKVAALKTGFADTSYILHLDGPVSSDFTPEARAADGNGPEEGLPESSGPPAGLGDESRFTEPVLSRLLAEYPNIQAIISLIGTPHLSSDAQPDTVPPVYALAGREEDRLPALLGKGVVKAAILYRPSGIDWDEKPPAGLSSVELFRRRFEIVRTEEQARANLYPP